MFGFDVAWTRLVTTKVTYIVILNHLIRVLRHFLEIVTRAWKNSPSSLKPCDGKVTNTDFFTTCLSGNRILSHHVDIFCFVYLAFLPQLARRTIVQVRPVIRGGEAAPEKFFSSPGKMCWTSFKTIGHSSKAWGPSQKTLRPSWCSKLVTGLIQV